MLTPAEQDDLRADLKETVRLSALEGIYARGHAVCHSNIRNDTMVCRFRDEVFEFPAMQLIPDIAVYNGYFHVADVEKLRALKSAEPPGK